MKKPVVKKKKGVSPIWILPFVALCIGSWLLYKGISEKNIDIIVHFHSAESVTAGKTKVMYKGLPIGIVKKITVDKGLDTVSMLIAITPEAKAGLVKDLKFWIVKPEIKVGKISGLNTLLSGSYITVQRGTSKEPCREFMGLDEAPPISQNAPGLHIKLKTDALHSIQKGSPLYYRNIQVGSVQDYTLEDDSGILISAYIEPQFAKMVKPGSRFWNASGLTLAGGLSGIKVHMESLTTLMGGGISFITPDAFENEEPAENGHVYKLYRDYEAAEYGINVTIKLENGEGLIEGITKVIFRGIEVGRIKKISLNNHDLKYKITAHLFLDPMAESILKKGTKFWIIRPKLSMGEVKNLDTLVTGPYITFMPGSGEPCDKFEIQGSNSKPIFKDGTFFSLAAEDIKSTDPGTPILFRHIQVGEVARYKLNKDNSVDLIFMIYNDYMHLINSKCVFWNSSGMHLKVTPTAFNLNMGSLQSIISGSITFDYPHKYYGRKLKSVKPGHKFQLYDSYENAVEEAPELKPAGILLTLKTTDPVYLAPRSPVYYRRVQVGEVTGIKLDSSKDVIFIKIFIKKKYMHLVRDTSKFFNMGGMSIQGDLRKGMSLKTPPVASVMMGGISFINTEPGRKVDKKHIFTLYIDHKAAIEHDYAGITIHFSYIQDIEINTKIKYHGMQIGYVKKITFENDMNSIKAECMVKPETVNLFRQGTMIWLVVPEVSIAGIRNVNTIFSGPYITLQPGGGKLCTEFHSLSSSPPVPEVKTGLNIVIDSKTLGSIKKGSPVFYRGLKVGRVTGYELSSDSRTVWIHLNIHDQYAPLVTTNTRFWNASGVKMNAGLFSGVDIETESVETIIAGGIAFATPEGKEMGKQAKPDQHFILFDSADEDWLKWQPVISIRK